MYTCAERKSRRTKLGNDREGVRVWCRFDFCAQRTNVNLCNRSIRRLENLGIFPYRWDRYFISSRPSAGQSLPCFAEQRTSNTHTHTHTHTFDSVVRFSKLVFEISYSIPCSFASEEIRSFILMIFVAN